MPASLLPPPQQQQQQKRLPKCGVTAQQNQRSHMEDTYVVVLGGDRTSPSSAAADLAGWSLFGVFDGHGGAEASTFLSRRLPELLAQRSKLLRLADPAPAEAIREALAAAEEEWMKMAIEEEKFDGSALAISLIDADMRRCLVANVGDCQAVIGVTRPGGNSSVEVLTEVHDAQYNADEVARVEQAGGGLWRGRLRHPQFNPEVMSLGVTRAIGDLVYKHPRYTCGKPSGLSARPAVTCTRLQADSGAVHQAMVLASDGFWNSVTYEDALSTVYNMRNESPSTISACLVDRAIAAGAKDNITVLAVLLP